MNWEQQLEVQAWVDGELSARDAGRVAAFVESDANVRALAEELRTTRAFVSSNEPEFKVADTREFYWSQIRRQIDAAEQGAAADGSSSAPSVAGWVAAWRRFTTPLSGFALVLVLAFGSFSLLRNPSLENLSSSQLVEVEDLSEDIGSISYKSASENMFVVYVYSKDAANQDAANQDEAADEDFGDEFFQ